MTPTLERFRRMPRHELQEQLRTLTRTDSLYLWEYVGLNWMYEPFYATREIARELGLREGLDVIGYRVLAGHVQGGALGDLMGVNPKALHAPHEDPFR